MSSVSYFTMRKDDWYGHCASSAAWDWSAFTDRVSSYDTELIPPEFNWMWSIKKKELCQPSLSVHLITSICSVWKSCGWVSSIPMSVDNEEVHLMTTSWCPTPVNSTTNWLTSLRSTSYGVESHTTTHDFFFQWLVLTSFCRVCHRTVIRNSKRINVVLIPS